MGDLVKKAIFMVSVLSADVTGGDQRLSPAGRGRELGAAARSMGSATRIMDRLTLNDTPGR
jgi:hypothetical protein